MPPSGNETESGVRKSTGSCAVLSDCFLFMFSCFRSVQVNEQREAPRPAFSGKDRLQAADRLPPLALPRAPAPHTRFTTREGPSHIESA